MAGVQIVFKSNPSSAADEKIGSLIKAYFISLPFNPNDFDKTAGTTVEDPFLRALTGIKDNPDLHLIMESERIKDMPLSWDLIQILPFFAFMNMLRMESGTLVVTVDDRVALAKDHFLRNNIQVEVIEHPKESTLHMNKLADALSVTTDAITRCIILTSKEGEAACAVITSSRKLNTKKVEAASGIKKLKEVKHRVDIEKYTGFDINYIPPAAMLGKMPCFVDDNLCSKPLIVASAGFSKISMKFSPESLVAAGFKPAPLT